MIEFNALWRNSSSFFWTSEKCSDIIHCFIPSVRLVEAVSCEWQILVIVLVFEVLQIIEFSLISQLLFVFIQPFNALAIFPETVLFLLSVAAARIGSKTMLFALVPPACVLSPVCP